MEKITLPAKVLPVKGIVADIHYGRFNFITDAAFHYDLQNDRILAVASLDDEAFLHLAQNKPELLKAEASQIDFDMSKMKFEGFLDNPVELLYGNMQLRRMVAVYKEFETGKQRFLLSLTGGDIEMLNLRLEESKEKNTVEANDLVSELKEKVANLPVPEPGPSGSDEFKYGQNIVLSIEDRK